MKSLLLEILICPVCLPLERRLDCRERTESEEGDIWSATLICPGCGTAYPLREGVASLLPEPLLASAADSRYESPALLSSYLWSHYADLFGDGEANAAYAAWGDLLSAHTGYALDAGCSVGRFTFEMAGRSGFAVGVDRSHSFIRTARRLAAAGELEFFIPQEGRLAKRVGVRLPEAWRTDNLDFLVADAQRLPFPAALFSSIASLNLVDKLPFPLAHLKEMNRVARPVGSQFLFSDPFSWSTEIAEEENWLGGLERGPFAGSGRDNVRALLTGENQGLRPRWGIQEEGALWWTIRNHSNHFERIRSWFLKAQR